MAEWRFLRSWSEEELRDRLRRAAALDRNFSPGEIAPEGGWRNYYSQSVVARAAPGPPEPGGPFERAREAMAEYAFSDPRIVAGHFDPQSPLLGRRMLLEIKVLGIHYLCAVVVTDTHASADSDRTIFGFRYDTLDGHLEAGYEWFVLAQEHASGVVHFRIEATWKAGQPPNWWSRLGFPFLVGRYQRAWHRLAHLRLRAITGARALPPLPPPGELVHEGPLVPAPSLVAASRERFPPAEVRPESEREGPERRRGPARHR